jgi:hypothetical protein
VQKAKEYVRGVLDTLLYFGVCLFGFLVLLSPALLTANIATVIYELFKGEMSFNTATSLAIGGTIYVIITSILSKYTPEGFPSFDLAMTILLTVFGVVLALLAITTPWWGLELERAAEMAGKESPTPISVLLMILAAAGAFGAGKEALGFYSRYKAHYRELGTVLKNLEGSAAHLAEEILGGVRRGQVAFLYNDDERVTHVLVGQALFPVRPGRRRYSPGNIREAPDEELVEFLQKRTSLDTFPPERILALLQGKGSAKDIEEAERVWAIERLSEF